MPNLFEHFRGAAYLRRGAAANSFNSLSKITESASPQEHEGVTIRVIRTGRAIIQNKLKAIASTVKNLQNEKIFCKFSFDLSISLEKML